MTIRHLPTLALALLAMQPSLTYAQDDPELAEAIRGYATGMSLSADPANHYVADFTGDGRPDVAAVLDSDGRSALVIFNRTARGYQAYPLYASLPAGPWQLRVEEPGRHRILAARGRSSSRLPRSSSCSPDARARSTRGAGTDTRSSEPRTTTNDRSRSGTCPGLPAVQRRTRA